MTDSITVVYVEDDERLGRLTQQYLESHGVQVRPSGRRAARPDAAAVVFDVADQGIGIAPDDLARVFEPFFRVERSRTRGAGGVGLSLTLARRIVEAQGGTIRIHSVPGEGTVVRVEMPARRS